MYGRGQNEDVNVAPLGSGNDQTTAGVNTSRPPKDNVRPRPET